MFIIYIYIFLNQLMYSHILGDIMVYIAFSTNLWDMMV
jgi:hypothetical protein